MVKDLLKVALVTGAGRGVGKATSSALRAAGYCVVYTGRSADVLEQTALEQGGLDDALVFAADVSDPEQVDRLFAAISQRFGRLDVLFNNAGQSAPAVSIDELEVADWRRVVDVNLTGSFLCARAAFRQMKVQSPQGGRIINNGSISSQVPRPNSVPYSTTKHAITGLTRCLSLDGRAHNIACGQIDIGNAVSDMTEAMADGIKQADGSIKAEPRMPAEEVADAVVHMAQLPLSTNIQFMTIMATSMPFVGRG